MNAQANKTTYEVAISGYACRLPQASNPAEFWDILQNRRCVITEITDDRWSKARFLHRDRAALGRSYTFAAGQVDRIWDFDPGFFGVSPREAVQMDPQQRLLLMTVWEAVEHAGLTPEALSGGRTGVYIGASASDHSFTFVGDPASVDAQFMTGNTLSIVSNRISYLLDLKGPSYTVDTACSSSFYALHQATQALRSGEIDTAIVGGVNALLSPFSFIGFSRATMLSPEGLCKAFDASADGYVRSEGAVVFVLRRMDLAAQNGDPVRGVILGSGVNSDGRTVGMAMPSAERQADLLRQIRRDVQFDPDDLAFLECHGTGTPVGDPMEANAIGEVFGRRRARPLSIGSAKTNFGHLEPASGLVGLLKAQMALEKGVYPASLHLKEPNPNIAFDDLNLEVAGEAVTIEPRDRPWLAGVNSFGFGGANAHVVIRQPDPMETPAAPVAPRARALTISAASRKSLDDMVARWREALDGAEPAEADRLVNAAAHRRQRAAHRLIALGESADDILAALTAHEAGETPEAPAACVTGQRIGRGEKTAFVFGGNGSQWAGMGLGLYEQNEVFRAAFDEVSALFAAKSDIDLSSLLAADDLGDLLAESRIAQPILFALQVAIVRMLAAEGLKPDAVAGHSVGEVAAAWAAGVLSLPDAVHLIRTRSTALEFMKGMGGMAAVLAGEDAVEAALADFGDVSITVAGDNSPRSSTIAGPVESLKGFARFARKRRIAAKLLDIDYPYHSPAIDPIRAKLIADLSEIEPHEGEAIYVSATSGREAPGVALDTEYWWRNARQPVRFREAVGALAKLGCGVFVEIAPRPVLQSYIVDTLESLGWGASVVTTLEQRPRTAPTARSIAARALAHGAKIDDARFFGAAVRYQGGLPGYAWQTSPYRMEPSDEAVDIFATGGVHPLLGWRLKRDEGAWSNIIDVGLQPWLADHRIDGAIVFPAAGYVEMALAAGRRIFGNSELSEFEILRPIVLDDGAAVETRVSFDQSTGQIRIESRRRLVGVEWGLNAFGVLRKTPVAAPVAAEADLKGAAKLNGRQLYQSLEAYGLNYGAAFQRIKSVRINGVVAKARLTEAAAPVAGMSLDPTMLDGAMHMIFPLIRRQAGDDGLRAGVAFLPVRLGRVRLYAAEMAPVRATARLVKLSPRGAEAEIDLLAEDGTLIAAVTGLRLKSVVLNRGARDLNRVWRQSFVRLASSDEDAAVPDVWADPAARAAALGVVAGRAPEPDVGSILIDALSRRLAWNMARRFADEDMRIDIASAIDLDPSARPLLSRALLALEEDGAFSAETLGVGRLAADCPYPSVEELAQALAEEAPTRGGDLMALLRLEAELPDRLQSGLIDVAPAPPAADITPAARAVWAAVETILTDIAAGWSAVKPLDALVVGAAPVGVIQRLAAAPGLSRLTVTDPDERIVETLSQIAGRAPKLRILPFAEAVAAGHDLAICGDSLSRLGRDGLSSLAVSMVSGGLFAAIERAPDLTSDLLCGIAEDWWAGSLTPEAPIGRRMPAEDWCAAMTDARLVDATATPLAAEAAEATALFARARRRVSGAEAPTERRGAVVVLHDGAAAEMAAAGEIEAAMAAIGRSVRVVALEDGAPDALEPGWETVFLPGLFADDADDLARAAARVGRVHDWLAAAKPARLWLVTRGGRPAVEEGASGARRPAEAALWGLGRVLANEPGHPEIRLADFDPAMEKEQLVELLSAELAAPSSEREIVWDAAGRAAPRVEAVSGLFDQAADSLAGAEAARALEIGQQGSFDSLKWVARTRRAPGPDEVEIRIRAAGLNFRDVMWAQGLLPEEALEDGFAGATLGMECAGIVTRAGAASGRSPGDEVIAFGPACFATHATIPARAVAPLPAGTSFDTAAAVPTIFITAQYGLVELANLRSDEAVLIHGGAGGVGLAAIQIARRIGARIIATAGSPAKRRLLKALGADLVFDSRSLAFADEVMAATGGEGVDVVLNSLSGEAMERSLGCLRPFGRFIELGKRDYYANSPIGLRPFRRNLTYFGVDADQLLSARPDLADRLFRDLADGFASGAFTPPPAQVFEADEAVDAFRLMQKSGHVGKIVIRPPSAPAPGVASSAPIGEGAWLIVGGTGGFGLETASWLVGKGVRALWLASRSGAVPKEGRSAVAAMRRAGATVHCVAADVADAAAVEAMMREIEAEGTPLKGVVHSAMVLDDALFESQDPARLEAVMRPKIAGAALIDRATRGLGLDHFIVYSSVTTLFGNPGQAAYVAANTYLESLMAERRMQGEPGLAVGWGPIGDIGYLAREEKVRSQLSKRMGGALLSAADALKGLETILAAGAPEPAVTFAPLRWGLLAGELPLLSTPLFERVETTRDGAGGGEGALDLQAMIEGLDDVAAQKAIIGFLATETGRILRQPPGELDPRRPLTEMGFDSLMAVDLKMAVEERIGASLPLMSLSDGVALADLAKKLLDEARGRGAGNEAAAMHAIASQHVAGGRIDEADRKVVEKITQKAESMKAE
ncbi:SDR family NAD(P)-dependent oxidoreductase [Pikeienuella sp. HZG-20]|uniref:SDR family NAD(P)-dependent oxidoreductase n=1 Tax=Paludibacillus litoralis TaxID=3133267 RepID=UPI0030EDC90F